jgi:hypothetical protein
VEASKQQSSSEVEKQMEKKSPNQWTGRTAFLRFVWDSKQAKEGRPAARSTASIISMFTSGTLLHNNH